MIEFILRQQNLKVTMYKKRVPQFLVSAESGTPPSFWYQRVSKETYLYVFFTISFVKTINSR